ncbi:hypothetical protein SAMN05192545_3907 [Maribacter dokdonensis]|uniref:Uncharacterized protein n=1 Tax=Maribacter dokdonensis TaxID=320912 RepID=A0ABY0V0H5_9FLAO|nr:hypothetical protein SAMN05192545_3907 [Maribacter dokdonensis]
MIRVLTNILYNSIVELAILACVLLWLAGACTVFLPVIYYNIEGKSYFNIKDFIKRTREYKLKRIFH